MSGIVFHLLPPHYNPTDPISRNILKISISHQNFHSNNRFRFLLSPPHASSSSSSVSGSEQWLDPKRVLPQPQPQQQRKKRIAGIDQDELFDPQHLADPDSCFCEFKGVHIHHKLYSPQPSHTHSTSLKIGLPIILLHGFGASVFSWSRVMKRLAEVAASKVLAFDRPAFGLTSRLHATHQDTAPPPLNPYSMAFSVLATLYFIDFLASDKAILIGHSAGSLVAVNSYFEAPERIAALILVAPAIIAPRAVHKITGRNETGRDTQDTGKGSNSNMLSKQFVKLLEILSKFTEYITREIMQMIKGMAHMLNSLYKKALSAILCSAFGIMLVSEHVLDGYTKPLRAKGWDKALAEFAAETLATSVFDSNPPLSRRLHEISCPVLIVTGDSDRIVPSWNAKKLLQAIPGSCLEVIKHCGHLPHEERVEEFVSVVMKFLQRAFADSKEPSVQATT